MAQMEKFASIVEAHERPASVYDQYDGVEHVSEYEFHKFYEENPNASLVIQGFVTMVHRDLTGEPAIAYSMMFKITDAQKLKMFLFAFGEDFEYLKATNDINELWQKCVALFGESRAVKKEIVSVALPGGMDQVRDLQAASRGTSAAPGVPRSANPEEEVTEEEKAADAILDSGDFSDEDEPKGKK